MITKNEYNSVRDFVVSRLDEAGIFITEQEKKNIEIADFNLGHLREVGLQIIVYVNTERVCAKELVMLPYQTCPQHKHVASHGRKAKEETFRCRKGRVLLYVEGKLQQVIKARKPMTEVSVYNEIVLNPGDQYTIKPNTWHWFQAGPAGAIVSEFSTASSDDTDVFFDSMIIRKPFVEE